MQAFPTDDANCKDSICNVPERVLGSYIKGPNNKIYREWAKRLGLGHRTVVCHGVHVNRTRVTVLAQEGFLLGMAWEALILGHCLSPPFWISSFSFLY